MWRTWLVSTVLVLSSCGAAAPRVEHPAARDYAAGVHTAALAQLLNESWEAELRDDPFTATMLGDHRFDADVPDLSAAGIAGRRARTHDDLDRARALEAGLDPADRITWRLFVEAHEADVAMEICELELWNDSPMSNLIVALNQIAQIHEIHSAEDGRTYVARMRGFARMLDQDLANLRVGVTQNRVAPQATLERLIALADRTLGQPTAEWTCASEPLSGASSLTTDERSAFANELTAALESEVRPAIQRFRDGLASEILPHARDAEHEGVASLPDGPACYAATIRAQTTTTRSAEDLHALGESEIARTDAQLIEIGQRLFGATTIADVVTHLRGDPTLGYASSDAILEDARRFAHRMAVGAAEG